MGTTLRTVVDEIGGGIPGGKKFKAIQTGGPSGGDNSGNGTNNGGTPATGDTGVLVWVIALPVTILAAAFVLKRKEREA